MRIFRLIFLTAVLPGEFVTHGIRTTPERDLQDSDFRDAEGENVRTKLNRLIYVYHEDGCRGLEGFEDGISSPPAADAHSKRMLSELQRRIAQQQRGERTFLSGFADDEEDWVPTKLESHYLGALEMEVTEVPQGMTVDELEQLSSDLPCVKYVARDDIKVIEKPELPISVPQGAPAPGPSFSKSSVNDPLFKFQWALKGGKVACGTETESVWRDFGWKGSKDMIIAIIDSGCNLNHEDMGGQFWRNPGEICDDGIDNDGNGFIDDCAGWDFVENKSNVQAAGTSHGSAASGIIAAKSNNHSGISGICPECKLMCLRFIHDSEGTVANEVRAIDYSVRMGARISNNSYGGYADHGSRVERDAIDRALRQNHLFVTSAGNSNMKTDGANVLHTPSGYPLANILSVGASTEVGGKTSFSNYGKKTVHMFAPGSNILSTGKDGYMLNQGTSFAAPHVAGIAGLIWSKYPSLTIAQLVWILKKSCRKTAELSGLAECGGVINAPEAMRQAQKVYRESLDKRTQNQAHLYNPKTAADYKDEKLFSALFRAIDPINNAASLAAPLASSAFSPALIQTSPSTPHMPASAPLTFSGQGQLRGIQPYSASGNPSLWSPTDIERRKDKNEIGPAPVMYLPNKAMLADINASSSMNPIISGLSIKWNNFLQTLLP